MQPTTASKLARCSQARRCSRDATIPSVCASRCGRRKSDLCSGRRGLPESLGLVLSPRPTPPSNLAGVPACCTALLFLRIPCPSPLRDRRPQPHAANWRLPHMRLELTMFMLSLSSTVSRVCLTVQKPIVRTYRIEKTLPQYSEPTFYTTFAGSSHTLHRTDITRVGTPCSFFIQSLSPTYSYTPFAFDLIKHYLVLCAA